MTAQDLAIINTHLSWICQELCIEPAITIQKADVTQKGYVVIHYIHFSDVDGVNFAQDFEKLLNESFRHVEVFVADGEKSKWLNLHITFKYDPIKLRIYKLKPDPK